MRAFDLNIGARESIDDDAGVILLSQQFAQQQVHDFAIADHDAGVLESLSFRRIEQGTDDDGRTRQSAGLADERGVGALAGTRRSTEKNDFLWESQILAAEVGLEILPNGFENQ